MKDLVKIIKENPGCKFIVDNDCWQCYAPGVDPFEEDAKSLCDESNVIPIGDGYGSGNCYGGDILQALAKIVGVEIESV